jgi:beta-phosphoglucomutase-like phosphatase (HAD superfamily)
MVLEDSAPGIEAAHRSGAIALLIPEHWPADPEMCMFAHEVFRDLHQVKEWLTVQ